MPAIDFLPSQVRLSGMFGATFDHMEAENTAAVIVKVLSMNGDVWRPATFVELSAGFELLTKDDGPWRRWFNNPFARIDMHDLVKRGFATWDCDSAIKFTDVGLERMRKWVTIAKAEAEPEPPSMRFEIIEGTEHTGRPGNIG